MLTQVEIVGIEEGAAVRDQGRDELECPKAMHMTGKFTYRIRLAVRGGLRFSRRLYMVG